METHNQLQLSRVLKQICVHTVVVLRGMLSYVRILHAVLADNTRNKSYSEVPINVPLLLTL